MTSQPRADRGDKRAAASRARRYVTAGLVAGAGMVCVCLRVLSTARPPGRPCSTRTSTVATVVSGPRAADRHGVHRAQRHPRPGKGIRQGAAGQATACCRPRRRWISPSTPRPNEACSGSRFTRASPAIPVSICSGRRARRWIAAGAPGRHGGSRQHAAARQSRRQLHLERHRVEVRAEPDSTARVSGRRRPAAPREPQRRHHPVRDEPRRRSRRAPRRRRPRRSIATGSSAPRRRLTMTTHNRRDDDRDKARLFIIIGDNGRRGQTQNLEDGPFGPGIPDDQFGGPEPDNAHLTGVVLRLNDDGTTPRDNPFFELGRRIGGEVGANIQKIFAYGIRNSFGHGRGPPHWLPVEPGEWRRLVRRDQSHHRRPEQRMGAGDGTAEPGGGIQDDRDDGAAVLRLAANPVAADQHRRHPGRGAEASLHAPWRPLPRSAVLLEVRDRAGGDRVSHRPGTRAPVRRRSVRRRRRCRGSTPDTCCASTCPRADAVWRSRIPRLADRVADNTAKHDPTESETLRFGTGFGVGTDIQTGPNGNLFVVSLSNGAIYEIHRR